MTTRSKNQGSYRGDAVLAGLLMQAKSGKSVADVRDLLAGVLAAPPPWQADAWVALIDPEPGDELVKELKALKQAMAADYQDGLDAGPPAPAWRLKLWGVLGLGLFVAPRHDRRGNVGSERFFFGYHQQAPLPSRYLS